MLKATREREEKLCSIFTCFLTEEYVAKVKSKDENAGCISEIGEYKHGENV